MLQDFADKYFNGDVEQAKQSKLWYQYIGSMGGKKTVKKHGRSHMSYIGVKGFHALVNSKFGGNVKQAKKWLGDMGALQYASTIPWGKVEVFGK